MKLKYGTFIITVLALAAALFSGCMAGVTKEQRLDMFKEDALAGKNLRSHFSGSNADAVDSYTLSELFDPTDALSFTSQSITNLTFTLGWYTGTTGNKTATGEFTVVTDGVSETWYILWIDPDGSLTDYDATPVYP